ncbi:MAG: amidohydrolase family protein [Gemmatimonadales bacterium]|nr:amidohydrolase family protein [Gemmatimonadales bacterium]
MRISGGTLVTSAGLKRADVVVRNHRIEAVLRPGENTGGPQGDEPGIDATDLWVLPGAVDAHTHFGMPLGNGLTSLGWRESSEAALLGGTTTVIDFANPEREETLPSAVTRWRGMADGKIACDYGLHCTVVQASEERLAEIPGLIKAGIPTFKGFLAYKGRLMLEPPAMKSLMAAIAAAGGLLLVHAEDGQMNAEAQQVLTDTGRTAPRWHPLAHPPESEVRAVSQALEMAGKTGCQLEIVHASLGQTAELVGSTRKSRQAEAAVRSTGSDRRRLLCEVCLHHLFADDRLYEAGHKAALAATCSPPLRLNENKAILLEKLATGEIDFLSTDHCEFDLKTKSAAAAGGFPSVPNGCGGVGERLVVSHTLAVVNGKLSPERWVEAVASQPAELMGLTGRKGRLEPGYDADIVLFDPRPKYRWEPLGQSDRAGSLWAGLPVQGAVRDVWLRGSQVVAGGRMIAGEPGGLFLERRF